MTHPGALEKAARPAYLDYTYDMFLSSIDGEQSEAIRFSEWVDAVEKAGLYPFEAARLEAQYPRLRAQRTDGTPLDLLNFSSYNYLGCSGDEVVSQAAKDAVDSAKDKASDALDSAKSAVDSAKDSADSALDSAKDKAADAGDDLKDAADKAKDAANNAADAAQKAGDAS